ncbi:uncharacterized protein B0P05DRAFT_208143 [Gilbertella persicaria]|uniref:uncharacterized protein n=1 Tax=Gilbertella persicaria TaxID=101096 RepID=UPI00221F1A09|nr:uncharacterized protein B0P05DRAFT_208143 [Gilbertella persicaria]KAI8067027.1 hypothetical protein B0P05DRAFT_208143 [Gilbertella persicaria]
MNLEGVVKSITTSIPRYQNHISSLKKQGCTIIGYARKSTGRNDEENRKRLLNSMVQCLKERSLCDTVFVSWSCSAAANIASRDMNVNPDLLTDLIGVKGDTQSMISYINSSVTDICLVAIDFAGLSTNVGDLQNFFNTHKKLKTVLIDKLIYDNEFHEFKREAVLSDPTILSSFDCRSKPVQRSRKV